MDLAAPLNTWVLIANSENKKLSSTGLRNSQIKIPKPGTGVCGVILLFLLIPAAKCQVAVPEAYKQFSKTADSLFELKNYTAAAKAYSRAFESFGNKGLVNHRYRAACAWAQCGQTDSAFNNLHRLVNRVVFSDMNRLQKDSLMIPLHHDLRWKKLLNLASGNRYLHPENWLLSENKLQSYKLSFEYDSLQNYKSIASVRCVEKSKTVHCNFVSIMEPEEYRAKTIRLSGRLKCWNLRGSAGFWMNTENQNGDLITGLLKGNSLEQNSEWQEFEIKLQVPSDARQLTFGLLFKGQGQIWFDNLRLEQVE